MTDVYTVQVEYEEWEVVDKTDTTEITAITLQLIPHGGLQQVYEEEV